MEIPGLSYEAPANLHRSRAGKGFSGDDPPTLKSGKQMKKVAPKMLKRVPPAKYEALYIER